MVRVALFLINPYGMFINILLPIWQAKETLKYHLIWYLSYLLFEKIINEINKLEFSKKTSTLF
jgi:hypothetical protein